MVYYDYDYIISKKHNKLLDNNIIKVISKLNNNNYKIHNNHSVKSKNSEKSINLELNKLNNNNAILIFNNISKFLINDTNNKYFINNLINNSILQHNLIEYYVFLYSLFLKKNNNYNEYIINYIDNIFNKNINIKEKIIGCYLLLCQLFIKNIINNDNLNYFINYLFLDDKNDEYYDIILNSFLKIIKIIQSNIDQTILLKIKNRIIYFKENLKNSRLKFICLDILDIINNNNAL